MRDDLALLGCSLVRKKFAPLLIGDAGRVPIVEKFAHLDQGNSDGPSTRTWHYSSIRPNPREITAPIFSIGTLNAQGKTN